MRASVLSILISTFFMSGCIATLSSDDITNTEWRVKTLTGSPGNVTIAKDIVRRGEYSLKITLVDGDCGVSSGWNDCTTSRQRTEIIQKEEHGDGEYWYGLSIYIPQNFVPAKRVSTSYFQIYPTGFKPDFMLRDTGGGYLDSNLMGVNEWGTPITVARVGHLENLRGVWTDIVFHANWSKGDDGFFVTYVNGEKAGEFRGPTIPVTYPSNTPRRMDVGIYQSHIYRAKGLPKDQRFREQTVYFDEIRWGRTEKDVNVFW